jgi:predicted Zn-dependent protease
LTKSNGNIYLKSAYSDFAFSELGDNELAERVSREVVAARPQIPVYRANLARLLIATGQFDAAEMAITELETLNSLGSLDAMISKLRTELAAARSAAAEARALQVPNAPANR